MNPSIVNRKKIISKFNLEKPHFLEKPVLKDKQQHKDIMITTLDTQKAQQEPSNILYKLPLKIIASLPSNLLYNNKCCDEYIYNIKSVSNTRVPDFKSDKLINICVYTIINKMRISPFILFLLYKDKKLTFPRFKTSESVFSSAENKLNLMYQNYTTLPIYVSYKETENNIYLFYEIKQEYKLERLNYNSNWWWATISEIMNYKKIMNFDIDNTVYKIFYSELLLALLFDKNKNKHFVGQSLYYGGYDNYISFIASLGLPKEMPTSNLGPYYYFYSYYGAGRRAIWTLSRKKEIKNGEDITRNEYGVHKHGGIVRFIVFGNEIKFFLNRSYDTDDNSDISQELAKTNEFFKETLKIRDVDGNWAVNHDMAYIGTTYINVNHDKTKKNKLKKRRLIPQWAVRDFYQYYPLSYHYVNTDEFSKILEKEKAINMPYEYEKYDIE